MQSTITDALKLSNLGYNEFQSAKKILMTVLAADSSSHLLRFAAGIELEAANISATQATAHHDEAVWLSILLASNETYRQRNVDKLSLLSLAHAAKARLAEKFDRLEEIVFDGSGEPRFLKLANQYLLISTL